MEEVIKSGLSFCNCICLSNVCLVSSIKVHFYFLILRKYDNNNVKENFPCVVYPLHISDSDLTSTNTHVVAF
jgi:hypothetical protein